MLDSVLQLLPVVLGVLAGYLLRRSGAAQQRDGEFLFKLIFYICLPALMFVSLSRVEITADLAVFPIAAVAAVTAGYLAAWVVAARVRWPRPRRAVLLTAVMTVNVGFELPFIQGFYGAEGVARMAAFEAVMTFLTFSWAYPVAARGNPHHHGGGLLLSRVVRSPPLYGMAAGLLVNVTGLPVPVGIHEPIAAFGAVTPVLITLGIGLLFEPVRAGFGRALLIAATHLITGVAVAIIIVFIFQLEGLDRTIVLLLGVAPVTFVSVTFASLENLDLRLAIDALSVSMVIGFVLSVGIVLVTT